MAAHILRACNIFDAVTHKRCYHDAEPRDKAMEILYMQEERYFRQFLHVLNKSRGIIPTPLSKAKTVGCIPQTSVPGLIFLLADIPVFFVEKTVKSTCLYKIRHIGCIEPVKHWCTAYIMQLQQEAQNLSGGSS